MKIFYSILSNALIAAITNTFVWFAITFWVYLETRSVMATGFMAGIYVGTVALSGLFFGSLVDKYRKKKAMLISSICTLILFSGALLVFAVTPETEFKDAGSPVLWVFIVLALLGALAGNIRNIALPTMVSFLLPEEQRDKANGLIGSTNGSAFLVASVLSGMAVGFMGVFWMMACAIALTFIAIIHLWLTPVEEKEIVHGEGHGKIDFSGTIKVIKLIPGLFALIFFNTFNNFLGGVFMALMDAYGLSLVSVQVWGILWGVLSLGFIVGGLMVAKKGLGPKPVRTLFICNLVMWTICIFFTMRSSIVMLSVGMFIYLCLIPVVEAAEQTIIQKVIPPERQGRVFGFAQSIEQAASPITAFLIGPLAQYVFIPFMTTGAGVELIGGWFGTGQERGIALVFTVAGIIGLMVTVFAMRSNAYRRLSEI